MKKYIISGILLIILILVIYSAYKNYKTKQEVLNQPVEEKIIPVKIVLPLEKEISEKIIATGNLQAESEVMIYSKVAGKIKKNLVQLNSKVFNGEVVTIIDRDEVGYEYNPYEVKTNIKGVVAKVLQNEGAYINPNIPLIHIVDIDRVKVIAAVDELKIRFIKVGQEAIVTLQAYPDESFKARVTNISPICNTQSRTIDVELIVNNPSHRLKPGMYAKVNFNSGVRKGTFIPISAIIEKIGKKYVFVNQNGIAKSFEVITGTILGDEVEIISGLSKNQEIISVGSDKLNENDKINIIR